MQAKLIWIWAGLALINGACSDNNHPAFETPMLYYVHMENGEGIVEPAGSLGSERILFLRFGGHSFEPESLDIEMKAGDQWKKVGTGEQMKIGEPVPLGLFQDLQAIPWILPQEIREQTGPIRFRIRREGGVRGEDDRDPYWDQVIVVKEEMVGYGDTPGLKEFELLEAGDFGDAFPSHIRNISYPPAEIKAMESCMSDPVMDLLEEIEPAELSWKTLESFALPLDYQKILLAGPHDPDPAYAYQNGQWFIVWPGTDSTGISSNWGLRKDIWFAPAIRMGGKIIHPAPLSAITRSYRNEKGRFLPMLELEWAYSRPDREEIHISQRLFSWETEGVPQVFIRLEMDDPLQEASLMLAHGKRPNAFYWGDRKKEPTFVPYFSERSDLHRQNKHVLTDETGSVVLRSNSPLHISHEGVSETFIEFKGSDGEILIATPQVRSSSVSGAISSEEFREAREEFEVFWDSILSTGARAVLPSEAWSEKIDSWLFQNEAITRIDLEGKQHLSYGSYIYCNYYFGIEEGWATVAHAMWGNGEEAKKQAEIILNGENLDKGNYHHQYRNGLSSWYTAIVTRLTGDRLWLEKVSPAMQTNGYWTIKARKDNSDERSSLTRGLLPSHVYGGDVSTPAYSLYSSGTCLKGLWETAEIFRRSGLEELNRSADDFSREADAFEARITEVVHEVLDRDTEPPFLPFALEVEHREGKHEGPFPRLTQDHLGNYWNLFAPLFLHLGIFHSGDNAMPSEWITDYAEQHGGLFGGIPRFYSGLDGAYSLGLISEYMERSKLDLAERPKALAAIQSYMVHASSGNGHTIPEVSGFHPERLEWKSYERVVREALWNFSWYDARRYLEGYSSFTEPLGSGAGEGLWMIRNSLVDETNDARGIPDGGLFLLPNIPGNWLEEGKEIRLEDFPTAYGTISLTVKSYLESKGEVRVSFAFDRHLRHASAGDAPEAWYELGRVYLRLVPPQSVIDEGLLPTANIPLQMYDPYTLVLTPGQEGELVIKY